MLFTRCWARRRRRCRWNRHRTGELTSLPLCGRRRSHRRLLVPRCWPRRHRRWRWTWRRCRSHRRRLVPRWWRRWRWNWRRTGEPASPHLCRRCRSHGRLLVPRILHQLVSVGPLLSLISWRQAVQRRRCFLQSASHSTQRPCNQHHVMRIGYTRTEIVSYPRPNAHQPNPLVNCNIRLVRACWWHAAHGEAWLARLHVTRTQWLQARPVQVQVPTNDPCCSRFCNAAALGRTAQVKSLCKRSLFFLPVATVEGTLELKINTPFPLLTCLKSTRCTKMRSQAATPTSRHSEATILPPRSLTEAVARELSPAMAEPQAGASACSKI